MSDRKIDVSALVEERFSFDDIDQAFKKAATPGSYRVSVLFDT